MIQVALLSALLTQAPQPGTAVVVTNRTLVSAERARLVAQDVERLLREHQVPIELSVSDAEKRLTKLFECGTHRMCVAGSARDLGLRSLVVIQVAQALNDLAIHTELVDAQTAEAAVKEDVMVSADARLDALRGPLSKFAEGVQAAVNKELASVPPAVAQATPPPTQVDVAPRPPKLEAAPQAATSTVVTHEPASRPLWVWAPAAAGVVALGIGGYFVGRAVSDANQLDALTPPPSQAPNVYNDGIASRRTGVFFLVGGAVGVTATAALAWWKTPPDAPSLSLVPSADGLAAVVSGHW